MADFRDLIDLASELLGGSVLYANDDFFAEKENLLKPHAAVWKEHEYTDRGKWMDGWESRRKRVPGHDFVIVRLGMPGIVRGVVVDTSFFRGNYPDSCSIEGCHAPAQTSVETLLSPSTEWLEVLPQSKLQGNSENLFAVQSPFAFTHLRFSIFPDGGVARLRVHGEVVPEWRLQGGLLNELDLAAGELGSDVLACSDMFFGPKHNLVMPGRSHNMSGGWETKRRRGPGHDWVIVQLAAEGTLRRVELDTNHFKGNYPDTASLEGALLAEGADPADADWLEVLPRTKLEAHTRHFFLDELAERGPFSHLRLNVYPDGGISRLRAYGTATDKALGDQAARRIDTLPDPTRELLACCGSTEWVRRMVEARPFESWNALTGRGDEIWWALSPEDWLEAFRAHPRIGGRKADGHDAAPGRWSADEQSGLRSEDVASRLVAANADYEAKFGHIFIVCATGKSGEEMLGLLAQRMSNDPASELRAAAEEQRKITHLRLRKLVS